MRPAVFLDLALTGSCHGRTRGGLITPRLCNCVLTFSRLSAISLARLAAHILPGEFSCSTGLRSGKQVFV